MPDINTAFSQQLLANVMKEVKEFDDSIKAREASTYIEQYNGDGKHRWFTFDFRGFHWENYVDNAYDGKAQAWLAWLEKQKGSDNVKNG